MNREPRIADVGADVEPRPRPPWLLPAVIGVGGFALGLLVATTIGSTGPSEATPTLPPRQATTPTTAPAAPLSTTTTAPEVESEALPTLEELVPGFEGTLYFANFASSLSQERMTTWRSELSSPQEAELPAGFPQLDASGTRMAMTRGQSIDNDFMGGVISLFWNLNKSHRPFPDSDSFLGSGVAGLLWHATEPGQLAWVESDGDERWLLKTGDVEQPGLPVEPVTIAEFSGISWPLYWDDEYFVVASYELDGGDEPLFPSGWLVGLFDATGTLLATTDDGFVGRLATGEFVLWDSPFGPDDSPGGYLADSSFQPVGQFGIADTFGIPQGVASSSTGDVTAVLFGSVDDGPMSILIIDETDTSECRFLPPMDSLLWSVDGDWLIAQRHPRPDLTEQGGLSFIDPETCTEVRVPLPEDVGFLSAVGR
ncbi:MAG: hypothetical protein ACN4GK_00495 [Acidimicrobiia bacterium]